jgi:hypothetical protein
MESLRGLPTGVLVALGLLAVTQLSLQIWGLIDLSRRAVVPGGRKWLWGLAIIAGGVVGALAYLVIGRGVQSDSAGDPMTGEDRAVTRERAIDRLYGDGDANRDA